MTDCEQLFDKIHKYEDLLIEIQTFIDNPHTIDEIKDFAFYVEKESDETFRNFTERTFMILYRTHNSQSFEVTLRRLRQGQGHTINYPSGKLKGVKQHIDMLKSAANDLIERLEVLRNLERYSYVLLDSW